VLAARADAVVRDQLRRASLSCVLNIAEGAGQRSRAQKRNLYAIARGSAMECAAIVDVLRIRGLVPAFDAERARSLLVRVVQMLSKLDRSLA
jgi:four helix bundle protein